MYDRCRYCDQLRPRFSPHLSRKAEADARAKAKADVAAEREARTARAAGIVLEVLKRAKDDTSTSMEEDHALAIASGMPEFTEAIECFCELRWERMRKFAETDRIILLTEKISLFLSGGHSASEKNIKSSKTPPRRHHNLRLLLFS